MERGSEYTSRRDANLSLYRPDSTHSPDNDDARATQTHTKDLACKGVNNNYHAVVSLVYLVAKSRCTLATKAGRVARGYYY